MNSDNELWRWRTRGRLLIGLQRLGWNEGWKRVRQRARIATTVPGARGSGGSHAAASAAAAAAMMIVVDSSGWITRRRGWRPTRRRAGKRRGDETRGRQLADLHNMIPSRFVSSRRPLTSTCTYHYPMWKKERKKDKKRERERKRRYLKISRCTTGIRPRRVKNLTDASSTIETTRTDTRPAVHWSPG